MKDIYILKSGESLPAIIERMFQTHGPFTIEGRRLDFLAKVQVLVDSSTSIIQTTGTSTSKAKTGSMVGRAVVGGVLTGGSGAIIGGLSGKRESDTNTISSEVKQTEITAELIFEGENSLYVVIRSIEAFHWLLSFAGQKPLTGDELEKEKNKAEEFKELQLQRDLESLRKKSQKPNNQIDEINKVKSKYSAESIFFVVVFILIILVIYREYSDVNSSQFLQKQESIAAQNIESDLINYANTLVKNTESRIFYPEVSEKRPRYYVIEFQTSYSGFILKDVDEDPKAYDKNNAMNEAWEKMFCSTELKSIINNHNITMIEGRTLNNNLDSQAIAYCDGSNATTSEILDRKIKGNLNSLQRSLEGLDSLKH